MNCKTSPVNARPSNFGLLRCRTTGFRPALQASPRKALRKVCSSSLDPWKTLGVSHDADEKQIKKAYRKLALDNHPDLRGSEAAARFVKIQEAYEVVTGKRRGTTADSAPQSSTAAAGWDFHDWYWKFTAGKRWDQQRKKAPRSPAAEAVRPRSTGAPEEALRAQLAGLRRKAAFRARSRPPSPAHQPGETAASTETKTEACEGSGAKDWQGNGHTAEATSSAFESSSEEAQGTCTGHDEFAVSQLAGLNRRARTRQQQQSTAVNHSAEAQTMHHTVNATTVETEEILASRTEAEFGEERSAAAAAVSEMQAAADVSAIEADMGVGGSDGEPAWRGQLRCARDFMAEVQQRSTSSNIVAATFKGLRAHLAPTIAELTHRAAAAAAAPAAGQMRGSCREGAPTFFWGAPEVNTAGDEASRECAKIGVARAGDKEGSGQQGAAQVGQHLATQLAGLKRRSAIRQYPA